MPGPETPSFKGRRMSHDYLSESTGSPLQAGPDRLLRHPSLQQLIAREDTCSLDGRSGSPWPVRSPRPSEVYSAAVAELNEAEKGLTGSPVKTKLPTAAGASSSRGSSPARWKQAPGALSPMPKLTGSSPVSTYAGPALRQTLSARAASGGLSGDPARMLSLQEELHCGATCMGSPVQYSGLHPLAAGGMQPAAAAIQSHHHHQLQQQHLLASSSSSSSSSGGGTSMQQPYPGSSAGYSALGMRGPSGGGIPSSLLGVLVRDGAGTGVESPSRPRRAISAPGSQVYTLALQHATQQAAAGGACDSTNNSPRPHLPSSLAARVGNHPSYTNLPLDVSAVVGSECGASMAGPTPGSCDTPDSIGSPHSLSSLVLESPHHPAATRFKPRPPGSSSGGSASSTPHSLSCPGAHNVAGGQLQPHPPQSCRKAAKPPVLIGGPGSAGQAGGMLGLGALMECGSPVVSAASSAVDSPRLAAATAAAAAAGGPDTPGSSGGVVLRRRTYAHSMHGGLSNGGEGLVGSLGSSGSGALFGPGSGKGFGGPSLMRSNSSLAYVDSSLPNSPVSAMRPPSSSGTTSYLLSKQDSGSLGGSSISELQQYHVGGGLTPQHSGLQPMLSSSGGGGSSGRDSSGGGAASTASTGVPPLPQLTRDSISGSIAPGHGRVSMNGSSADGCSGSAVSAAANRPGSGKKTVCLLVDAVRSRDDAQLEANLAYCSGGVHGLNDRHPIYDRTPLHEAVCLGSSSMVKLLLAAGSEPNVGHPKEGSPLLQAAAVGATEIVQLLLDAGANVGAVDVEGLTALHHACRSGHVDTARLLISRGADLTARTLEKEAPMDLARKTVQLALCGAMSGAAEPSLTPAASRRSIDGHSRLSASGTAPLSSSHPSTPRAVNAGAVNAGGSTSCDGAASAAASSPAHAPTRSTSFSGLGTSSSSGGSSSSGSGGGCLLRRVSSSSGGGSGLMPLAAGLGGSGGGGLLALMSSGPMGSGLGSNVNSPNSQQQQQGPLAYGGLSGGSTPSAACTPSGASAAAAAALASSTAAAIGGAGFSTPPISPSSLADAGPTGMRRPSPPMMPSSLGMRGRLASGFSSDGGSTTVPSSSSALDQHPEERAPTPPVLQLPERLVNVRKQRLRAAIKGPLALEDTGRREQEDDQGPAPTALPTAASSAAGTPPGSAAATAAAATVAAGDACGMVASSAAPSAASGGYSSTCSSSQPTPGSGPGALLQRQSSSSSSSTAVCTSAAAAADGAGTSSSSSSDSQPEAQGAAAAVAAAEHDLRTLSLRDMAGMQDIQEREALQQQPDEHEHQPQPIVLQPLQQPQQQQQQQLEQQCSSQQQQQASIAQQQEPQQRHLQQLSSQTHHVPQQQQQGPGKSPLSRQPLSQPLLHEQQPSLLPPQQQQPEQPAAVVAFKFGLDPGNTAAQEAAVSAAAAAAAAVAAKHSQQERAAGGQRRSFDSIGSSYGALARTFRLHLADSVPRDMQLHLSPQQQQQEQGLQQPLQQQQQEQPQEQQDRQQQQQQQQGGQQPVVSWGRNHDPRFPPHLPQLSPPDTPEGQQQQQQQQQGLSPPPVPWASPVDGSAPHMWEGQLVTACNMQWRRGELLGEGAYGKVYAGLNQVTGEMMAVKTLQLVGRAGSPESQAQLEELKQELELYQHLSHTHIVGYIDNVFDTATNCLYIFLELVTGGSIASMLQRFGRFSEEVAQKYTRQLLLGLEYLHNKQIAHRDLKGGNALVTRDGTVKLADFGASKNFGSAAQTDMMKSLRGSVFWMAPEVVAGTGYGRKADIWSLGCTVIEMLTAKHPWPNVDNQFTAMMLINTTRTGPPRPPGLSAAANDFLDQCFKVDTRERASATQLLQHPWVAQPSNNNNTRTRAVLTNDEAQP